MLWEIHNQEQREPKKLQRIRDQAHIMTKVLETMYGDRRHYTTTLERSTAT